MTRFCRHRLTVWLGLLGLVSTPVRAEQPDPVFEATASEISRAMEALSEHQLAPYFLAVEVHDTHTITLTAENGGLHRTKDLRTRTADVDIRLGTPQVDSTHPLRTHRTNNMRTHTELPLSSDSDDLQLSLWRAIDRANKQALKRFAKVEAEVSTLVDEAPAMDLAPTEAIVAACPELDTNLDGQAISDDWSDALRAASAIFASRADTWQNQTRLNVQQTTRRFVSSHGTRVCSSGLRVRLWMTAQTIADDGAKLGARRSWSAHSMAELPSPEAVQQAAEEMANELTTLRQAPDQDPYKGPAILSGRATAVLFHEVIGHRVEGHRLKQTSDAQTFRNMVGEPVLPTFLSVMDDPTRPSVGQQALDGHYLFDNQGVPAQSVNLIEDGVLKGFLQSRSPVTADDRSNGHGRRMPGRDVVTRQGSLMVQTSQSISNDALREKLRREAARQGLEYGLFVEEIEGGFTITQRQLPNAFNVNVSRASRVYVDGRPDELVRGIDLIGTPLATFARISASGEGVEVFNGMCGAESGWVPVSAVAPPLLFDLIETQRKAKAQQPPPLLPAPIVSTEKNAPTTVGTP